jgi:hypothetical protein
VHTIAKELRNLSVAPPAGIKIYVNEEDITDIRIDIEGPGARARRPASARAARAQC